MNVYRFIYVAGGEHGKIDVPEVGLAEAVDTFIEEYCPVDYIESVSLLLSPNPDNREKI